MKIILVEFEYLLFSFMSLQYNSYIIHKYIILQSNLEHIAILLYIYT